MSYPAFFISSTEEAVKYRRPFRVNVSIKPNYLNLQFFKKIPMASITDMEIRHEVGHKQLSAGKAVTGAVLAGGIGAVVGGTMGGKKISSYLTVKYVSEQGETCELVLEVKLANVILKKWQSYRQEPSTSSLPHPTAVQPVTKPRNSSLKRGLLIYYTSPYQLYKKLKKGRS